jgi:hypothetical protein
MLNPNDRFEAVREYARRRGIAVPGRRYIRVPVGAVRIIAAIVIAAAGAYLWSRYGIPHG